MDAFDYVVLVAILAASILIGIYQGYKERILDFVRRCIASKRQVQEKNVELSDMGQEVEEKKTKNMTNDYLLANGTQSAIPIAFSLLASYFSATTLLGTPAEIYEFGIQFWIIAFGYATSPIFGAFLTGPFFAKLEILSIFEYFQMRHHTNKVRQFGMALYVIKGLFSSSVFALGPSTALSLLVDLDQVYSIVLICVIGTIYTCIGGIKAVIWTDLFQGIVMLLTMMIILIKAIVDAGGFSNIWSVSSEGGRLELFDFNPDPFTRQSFWSLYFGGFVYFIISYNFDQNMFQRFKAAKSVRTAQVAILLNSPGILLTMTLASGTGLALYTLYHKCDPLKQSLIKTSNQYVSYYVANEFNMVPGMRGLFLGAIFCSSLSSLSSFQNSMASILWKDFLHSFSYFKSFDDKKSLRANRIIVLVIGLICVTLTYLISFSGNNLVQLNAALNGAFLGPIISIFILSCFFSICNKHGAIFGPLFGFIINCWIAIGSFVLSPTYAKLPTSIEDCKNSTMPLNETWNNYTSYTRGQYTSVPLNLTGFDRFYALSFYWYTTAGLLVSVITGLLVSILTGGLRNQVDPALLIFDLSKCLLRKDRSNVE